MPLQQAGKEKIRSKQHRIWRHITNGHMEVATLV